MKVFKDAVGYNKDELVSDAFPIEELPALYVVTARSISASPIGSEDADAGERKVINLVDAHRLVESGFDKKGYLVHLKNYLKAVEVHLHNNGGSDQVPEFKAAAQAAAKDIVDDFDSYSFYRGENMDDDGMVILARPSEGDTWTFSFWKHGLVAEQY
ncbi:translationally-controlled tumor protein [Streptomyces lavendulocolor]|uniref:translationally-controlled tumor protein n=1 Tax=Streptomyces lavendulocolor TaxID=67316 RepID=UPI003C2FF31E